MRLVRGAGLGAGLVLLALAAAAASVGDGGRVVFASRVPLALTPGTPATVHVCATGVDAVPVSFLVEEVPAAAVILSGKAQSPAPDSVAGGSCRR